MKPVCSLAVMAVVAGNLMLFGAVHAEECLDPTAGLKLPLELAMTTPTNGTGCKGPSYDTSLGPIIDYKMNRPVQTPPKPPALGSGEGVDLYDLEAGTTPVKTDYNNRELERLGELDALQGRPVNMDRANDVDYLRGYTRGGERRMMQRPWR